MSISCFRLACCHHQRRHAMPFSPWLITSITTTRQPVTRAADIVYFLITIRCCYALLRRHCHMPFMLSASLRRFAIRYAICHATPCFAAALPPPPRRMSRLFSRYATVTFDISVVDTSPDTTMPTRLPQRDAAARHWRRVIRLLARYASVAATRINICYARHAQARRAVCYMRAAR